MVVVDKKSEDLTVVKFDETTKRLNIVVAEKFKTALNEIIDTGCKKLILDFSGIKFIDSSGFGSLVTVYNHGKNRETHMVLCSIAPETMQLIKITKLDQVFEIKENLHEAMQ